MIIYFLRHASAGESLEDPKKDEARGLDKEGIRQCTYMGKALAALNVTVDVASNYVPQPYDGRVTLFVATDDPTTCGLSHDLDPRLRWRRYVPNLEVQTLSGGHETIFDMPHAADLASLIKRSLEESPACR